MKRRVNRVMSSSVKRPARPKSTRPMRPSSSSRMFAGMRVAVEEAVAEDHRHPGVGHPVGELASLLGRTRVEIEVGELRSLAGTRASAPAATSSARPPSARPPPSSHRSCAGKSPRCGPRAGSRAPGGSSGANSSTSASASMKSRARTRSRTTRAAERISCRSDSICRGASGRCTFTTTSSPVGSVARCTWPIEAAAIGDLLESEERLLDREPDLLLDHPTHVGERQTASRRPAAHGARRRCRAASRPASSTGAGRT